MDRELRVGPTRYREVVLTSWDRNCVMGTMTHPLREVVLTSLDRSCVMGTMTHPLPQGGTDFMGGSVRSPSTEMLGYFQASAERTALSFVIAFFD